MLLFCGIPLFLIELILGHYSGAGPGNVFELSPIFKGRCTVLKSKYTVLDEILVEPTLTHCMTISIDRQITMMRCLLGTASSVSFN